ncbi:MAG: PilN domain-containing protein [Fibrobacter sp.]|nr:PilN domain-containing protein [Fibrobacter sp.]
MVERIEINLLPVEYRVHKKKLRISREVVYPVLVLVVIGIGLAFWSIMLQSSISLSKSELSAVEQQIRQNRPIHAEIKRLREDKTTINEKIMALERISVNREKWVRLMEVICGKLPKYTWLVSIREENSTPPIIYLEGRTFAFPEVANYMSQLKESEYITAVDLSNIEQVDPKERVFRFGISCTVNPDVKLQGVKSAEEQGRVVASVKGVQK